MKFSSRNVHAATRNPCLRISVTGIPEWKRTAPSRTYGRMRITGRKEDSLKFRVPSLRNVFLTFPYGHDGRFTTISEVLEHYNSGIIQSSTLDSALKKGISITEDDRFYLISFLGTLTDSSFIKNPLYSDPKQD